MPEICGWKYVLQRSFPNYVPVDFCIEFLFMFLPSHHCFQMSGVVVLNLLLNLILTTGFLVFLHRVLDCDLLLHLFGELLFLIVFILSSGNETKLAMSRGVPEPKLTAMDMMIDKLTGAIFIFQIVVVIVLGIAGNVWKDTEARKVCQILLLCFSCLAFLNCFILPFRLRLCSMHGI